MGLMFTCPECGTRAEVIAEGFVRSHITRQGETCTFTRTPGTGRARVGGHTVENHPSTIRSAAPRSAPVTKKARLAVKCPACGQANQARLDGTFRAHRTGSGSWCSAGDVPTEAQVRRAAERAERQAQKASAKPKRKNKKRTKKKGSVWTVGSGGLPGLGKRR